MQTPRSAFIQGLRDQAPFILGNIQFGLITGAAAVTAGVDPWLDMAMSVIMFTGAAQLAAISQTPRLRKWLFAYLLTDHAFALLTTKFDKHRPPKHLDAYYFGVKGATWCLWQMRVAVGVFAGTLVPATWSLDFAIPLVFLSLVLPALQTRIHWAAAFCTALPLKLGLIAAAVTGGLIGVWSERRTLAQPAIATRPKS